MRKILFRGRDHAGKMHEGSLIVINVKKPSHKDLAPYEVYFIKGQDFAGEEHEVDPETIGQLVFPATKMHPDIWEGDVIEDKYGYRMVVLFDYHSRTFNVIAHTKTSVGLERLDEGYLYFKFKNHGAKVVGNIHDNPELITEPFCDHAQKGQTN